MVSEKQEKNVSQIGARIKQYRASQKMSQQELADAIDVNRGYLGQIERGEKEPSFHFLRNLLDSSGLSSEWVLRGTKSMYATNSSIQDGDHREVESLEDAELEKLSCGLFMLGEMVYVPLSSITACCGKGYTIYDDYSLGTAIAVTRKNIGELRSGILPFAVATEGRSMEGYGIKEGSMLIVNPAERVYSGCVAMVVYGERASIKKVYDTPDGMDLLSSSGHKIRVTHEELSEEWGPRICGRVMVIITPPDEGI
jgi:transcriptional regulator with XRE-family HTH domain